MDIISVTKQFVAFYYETFQSNRSNLGQLYRDNSTLSFEGIVCLGGKNIIEKYTALDLGEVACYITTQDALPSTTEGSIIVLVTGLFKVGDNQNMLQFSQAFQLTPEAGTFYVSNDIFRLNYG